MKTLLTAILILSLGSISAQAELKKGQKAYLKQCKKCHGNGTKGASMKTQNAWESAFADEGKIFKKWHKDTKAQKYVNGKKFKKYAPHLKDFLYEYGSDSGNVPSCG